MSASEWDNENDTLRKMATITGKKQKKVEQNARTGLQVDNASTPYLITVY